MKNEFWLSYYITNWGICVSVRVRVQQSAIMRRI